MASPADIGLWHDYARQIKSFLPFSDDESSPQRIYCVPLTSVGISMGRSIAQSIVNHDLFRIGDLLLPPDSPVFLPGPSYSQRLLRYLQAVQIPPGKQDAVTLAAMNAANIQLTTETDNFLKQRREALELYSTDPERSTLSFDQWTEQYYPPYDQAQSQKNAASQVASDASKNYYGTQTDELWADKARVSRAFSEIANPPYNMPTSTAQLIKQPASGNLEVSSGGIESGAGLSRALVSGGIKFEPSYNIDASFSMIVMNWVNNAFNGKNKPVHITFHSTHSRDTPSAARNWNDVGFDNPQNLFQNKTTVLPIMPLFTAHWTGDELENSPWKQTVVSAGDRETSSITITITATDAQVFEISPGDAWNIADAALKYPILRPDASPDLYDPFVLVTNVLLGYMVSVTFITDSSTFSDIDNSLQKAQSSGGRATLFGLDIGPVSSGSTVGFDQLTRDVRTNTIFIPPRDSGTLTLLGIVGKKLATPQRSSSGK